MVTSKTALVTGATGAVGVPLVKYLLSSGYRVRVMCRDVPQQGVLPLDDVELRLGDVVDEDAVSAAIAGSDIVFHLAAKLHVSSPSPSLASEYWRTNVEGSRIVARAAARAEVSRFVYFSTISVYGATGPIPVDETIMPKPDSLYAETKLAGENAILEECGRVGKPSPVILRLASIYGPTMKGNYVRLVQALAEPRKPRLICIGDLSNRRTLIHMDDLVRAAELAGRSSQISGRIINVSDGRVHTMADIIEAICEPLHRSPPRLRLPLALALGTAHAVDNVASLAGARLKLKDTIDKFVEDVAVRSDVLCEELDFQPQYDLRQGWAHTIEGMRQQGLL